MLQRGVIPTVGFIATVAVTLYITPIPRHALNREIANETSGQFPSSYH